MVFASVKSTKCILVAISLWLILAVAAGSEPVRSLEEEKNKTAFTIITPDTKPPEEEFRGTTFSIITPTLDAPLDPVYIPFNFTNIFLVGGHCTVELDWYSKFVAAGMETLNITQLICAEEPDAAYTREFHVEALRLVEERVGDKLNETLVITVAIGLESDWSPVADLLRKGMAFFHAKEDPLNFNLTEYDLRPEDVLYFYFRWDEFGSAERTGAEICRVKGGVQQFKVAKVHMAGRNGGLNYRSDEAVKAFSLACPETEILELWEIESGQSLQAYKTTLLFNPLPDVVFCGNDAVAAELLGVAKEILTADQYSRLATTGWDNTHPELLRDHKILTTVDQMVHYPNRGIWKSINTVASIMQEFGFNSTKAVQTELGLDDSLTIAADTLTISSDRIGFLIGNLLQGYDAEAPPYREVDVSTGLFDVTITEMIPFEGKFKAVLWMRMSWNDPRLKWNPFVYEGNAPLDNENVWTPGLYFKNGISFEELYVGPAVVNYLGEVVMERNIVAEFLCSTTERLRSFPFDSYHCSMDLGAPKGITLDQNYGFQVIESDPHFSTTSSMAVGINNATDAEQNSHGHVAYYQLSFSRRPFTAYVRLILPAILINLVGFMAFWIPSVQESVALGVTSLLCSLAFRETVDMPDTADVTWTEVFIMINISYQASVMLIIWISYGSSWTTATYHRSVTRYYRLLACYKAKKDAMHIPPAIPLNSEGIPVNMLTNGVHDAGHDDEIPVSSMRSNNSRSPSTMPVSSRRSIMVKTRSASTMNTLRQRRINSNPSADHEDDEIVVDVEKTAPDDYDDYDDYDDTGNGTDVRDSDDIEGAVEMARLFQKASSKKIRKPKRPPPYDDDDVDDDGLRPANVDWIGRWFVVPSYFLVILTLLLNGWGFYNH